MKTKHLLLLIILIAITMVILLIINNHKTNNQTDNFINLGTNSEKIIDENYKLLTNYNEYQSIINDTTLTEKDFENNNYLLFIITYNECREDNIEPESFEMKNNIVVVNISYNAKCGFCVDNHLYYLLKLDKNVQVDDLKIHYNAKSNPHCDEDVDYKPIIYLYPDKEMDIEVKLGNDNLLLITYPKYENGWKVKAYPNGDLIDRNNRYQYALYWEGKNHFAKIEKDGFVIEGKDTITFLEEKLKILGLNEREADEFIIYWLPKLEHNKYNYIRFETIDEINNYMPLIINPKPDTIIRILMDFKALDEKIEVTEQKLVSRERIGFTVVEWGGSIIK